MLWVFTQIKKNNFLFFYYSFVCLIISDTAFLFSILVTNKNTNNIDLKHQTFWNKKKTYNINLDETKRVLYNAKYNFIFKYIYKYFEYIWIWIRLLMEARMRHRILVVKAVHVVDVFI